MQNNNFRLLLSVLVFVFSFSVVSFAQTAPSQFPSVNIKNFGQMDERYFRGAQPEKGDYKSLKDLGVTTVIDLHNDPTDYEKSEVEALGMKYINIPMSGWKYPKESQINQFLQIMNDSSTGTVFVHCKAGKHRTGVTGAVYRFTKYGWDYDKAYKEMKNYNFTIWMVHGMLKVYVGDYAEKMQKQQQAKLATNKSTSQSNK